MQLVLSFGQFFTAWYVDGSAKLWQMVFDWFRSLERKIALKETIHFWFQPLFQDYTVLGHILGFILRTLRIIVGGVAYALVFATGLILYVVWLSIPAFILTMIFLNLRAIL